MVSGIAVDDPLLTPAEVAAMFKVTPKTVSRWAERGQLRPIRTVGGHRRFRLSDVQQAMEKNQAFGA